jgi:hypothetical protein
MTQFNKKMFTVVNKNVNSQKTEITKVKVPTLQKGKKTK